MTSNLGGELIQSASDLSEIKDQIGELMKATFKPEFLNRIDETILFNRLGKEEILKIVDIQLMYLNARLAEKKIELKVSNRAKAYLVEVGYDPLYGARPLKRAIQTELQNPLAKLIISGKIREGTVVQADQGKDGLAFRTRV
jgi:ATP-dependent Clp protease ATP-binding subunit ClpB